MTENHQYKRPQKGSRDWHIPLNNNFQLLDTDVEIRDDQERLDKYVPKSGAKFLATDTENQFVGDGTKWIKIDSSGKTPSFTSVSTKDISVDNNVIMYVRTHGDDANDGLSTSNAKSTIQAAYNDAPITRNERQLIIDIDASTYTGTAGEILNTRNTNIERVRLLGETDGSGNPATVFDAGAQNYGIHNEGGYVEVENIHIKDAGIDNVLCFQRGVVELVNSKLSNGTQKNLQVAESSYVLVDSDSTLVLDTASQDTNIACFMSKVDVQGTVEGGGNGVGAVIQAWSNGFVVVNSSATVKGHGSGTTTSLLDLREGGTVKSSDATFGGTGAGAAVYCKLGTGGVIEQQADPLDVTDVYSRYNNGGGTGGVILDSEYGERAVGLPNQSATQSNLPSGGGMKGNAYYDDSVSKGRIWNGSRDLVFGRPIDKLQVGGGDEWEFIFDVKGNGNLNVTDGTDEYMFKKDGGGIRSENGPVDAAGNGYKGIENVDNISQEADMEGEIAIDKTQARLYLKDKQGNIGYINLDGVF